MQISFINGACSGFGMAVRGRWVHNWFEGVLVPGFGALCVGFVRMSWGTWCLGRLLKGWSLESDQGDGDED